MIAGNAGHYRQLVLEGCDPNARLVAIGHCGDREKEATAWKGGFDKFISSRATLYVPSDLIGEGSQVMAGAVVYAPLGKHCIIGTSAVISHDCVIEDFVFVGPGAVVAGYCKLRRGCFIGAGAAVTPETEVPAGMLLKAGARMTGSKTVPDGALVVPRAGRP